MGPLLIQAHYKGYPENRVLNFNAGLQHIHHFVRLLLMLGCDLLSYLLWWDNKQVIAKQSGIGLFSSNIFARYMETRRFGWQYKQY